jgi:thiamine-phosphate pyrophosphorylase
MSRRQSIPQQWLIVNQELDRLLVHRLNHLPRGCGILVLRRPRAAGARALRRLAIARDLVTIEEAPATAARVHTIRELTRARLRGARLILVSPVYPTRSHPGWTALPTMRAATLARLAGREAIALGGMNDQRFRRVQQLGFIGWAGIGAWVKFTKAMQ